MVEISTNAICFEGICRVYRNAVVDRVREVLRAKYPDTWEEEIAKPFGNKEANGKTQWENRQEAARQTRSWGLVETPLADEGDLLDVSHFRNLFEKHLDALLPDASDWDELGWSMQSVKNLRDPVLGHPAGIDMLGDDARRMLDDAKKVLGKIGANAAAERISKLRAAIPQGKTGTSVALEEVRSLLSINAICFEGINRVYRNVVVKHIHSRLSGDQISGEFQKERNGETEWENRKRNAESLHSTGDLTSPPPSNDADLLDITHFPDLFKKYAEILFPEQNKRGKEQVRRWAKEISDYRGALIAHPAALEASEDDAQRMLDDAERILRYHIRHEDAAKKVAGLRRMVASEVAQRDESPTELPAPFFPSRETVVSDFFGREEELDDLSRWLKKPREPRRWALEGDGGKGKSAIAYHFAESVITKELTSDLAMVIWLSAKREQRNSFTRETEDIASPDFWNLESAQDKIIRAYEKVHGNLVSNGEKDTKCLEWLEVVPALIILDDFDSLRKFGETGVFFETRDFFTDRVVTETSSRVLLTSRIQVPGFERQSTIVEGFKGDDGLAFVDKAVEWFKLPKYLFTPEKERDLRGEILAACEGSPLFVEDLLRLCKTYHLVGQIKDRDGIRDTIAAWRDAGKGDEVRKYALEREIDTLSEVAREVLLTCALFPAESISRWEIDIIVAKSVSEIDTAILTLQGLFLMDAPKQYEEEKAPRFSLNSNTRSLVEILNSDLKGRVQRLIKESTEPPSSDPIQYTEAIWLRIKEARKASSRDRRDYPEAVRLLKDAIELYLGDDYGQGNLGDLHGRLARVYYFWGRYTDAREHYRKAAAFKCPVEATYVTWCQMETLRKEWSIAAEAAESGLDNLGHSEGSDYRRANSAKLYELAGKARSKLAEQYSADRQERQAADERARAERHFRDRDLVEEENVSLDARG